VAAVVATRAELQERAALKQVGMTAAMAEALGARAVVGPVAPHSGRHDKDGVALVFTEVNGCRYCKAVHTFAATIFGNIPADELELFQQAAPRGLSTAPLPPSRRRQSKSHGKVSDADLEAVR
jgi:AhpD family alkylhydroperoxidase